MSGRESAVWALLGAAGLVVVLCAVGLLAAPTLVARLHYLTPLTSLAGPLVAVAYLVDQGPGLAWGLVVATVGVLAVTGPPLGAAIGRLDLGQREGLPAEPPR